MSNPVDVTNSGPAGLEPAIAVLPVDERSGPNGHAAGNFSRDLLVALQRFKDGDFDARLASDFTGIDGKIADVFNEILASARGAPRRSRACAAWSARKASSSSA